MAEYTNIEQLLLSLTANEKRQKLVDKHAVVMNLFQTLLLQNHLHHRTLLLFTEEGLILNYAGLNGNKSLSGFTINPTELFLRAKN